MAKVNKTKYIGNTNGAVNSEPVMAPIDPLSKGEPQTAPLVDFGHERLLECLFFFWDGFERASLNFFLTGDTAKQVIKDEKLVGDKLTLGIRKMEWQGGQDRVFRAFMEHERISFEEKDDTFIYQYKEIPVYLHVYEDNSCLDALDIVFYANETFNVPNPYKIFEQQYEH